MDPEFEDKQLQEILSKARITTQIQNFEDELMRKIHKESRKKANARTNKRVGLIYFLIGSLSGFFLVFNASFIQGNMLPVNPYSFLLLILSGFFSLVVLLMAEN